MGFFSKLFNDSTPPSLHSRDGMLIPPNALSAHPSHTRNTSTSRPGQQSTRSQNPMSQHMSQAGPSMHFNFPGAAGPSHHNLFQHPQRSQRGPGVSRHDFAHPQQSHHHYHPAQPAPRPGRLREGAPLPAGHVDPMATASSDLPLGHHGMREHVLGMTALDVGRHGAADDPRANWKVLRDIEKLQKEGEKKRMK